MRWRFWPWSVVPVSLLAFLVTCSPAVAPSPAPDPIASPPWPDLWARLQEQVPYPYTTPLPPAQKTGLDGTYSKLDPREGARPFCRRCMAYPSEGGLWLLRLDRGVYRIFSTRSLSGWRSLGSYSISGDRIFLFNDPHCMDAIGVYGWKLDDEALVMEVIEDECADGFRGIAFSNYPWLLEEDP